MAKNHYSFKKRQKELAKKKKKEQKRQAKLDKKALASAGNEGVNEEETSESGPAESAAEEVGLTED